MKRVITFGAYDNIQFEDVDFLKRAKSYGDYLIVAVLEEKSKSNEDESFLIKREFLEAIRYVDLVIRIDSIEALESNMQQYMVDVVVTLDKYEGMYDDFYKTGCEVFYLSSTSKHKEDGETLLFSNNLQKEDYKSFIRERKKIKKEYQLLAEKYNIEPAKIGVNDNFFDRKLDEKSILICGLGVNVRGNMQYILNELNHNKKYDGFKIYVRTKENTDDIVKGYIKKNKWERTETLPRKYNVKLETCKYLFTESYYPYSWVKRPGQVVINIWHGTPLKCIGFEKSGKSCHVNGTQQKNFIYADYLLYPNPYTREKNLLSYRVESLLPGKALMLGYPRTGGMLAVTNERKQEVKKELAPNGERIYAYMPTWRGYLSDEQLVTQTKELLVYLDNHLRDDQLLYVNLHHKIGASLNYADFTHIKQFPPLVDSYELLTATDALISDYSSVFFDYLALRKQIILHVEDYRDYLKHQGLYIDVEQLPFDKAYSPQDIIDALNRGKTYDDTEIFEKICSYDSKDNAKKLCQLVLGDESGLEVENHRHNDKKKILLYSHFFESGEQTLLLEMFTKGYNREKFEVYLCCNQEAVNETLSSNMAYPLLRDNLAISTSNDSSWLSSLGKTTKTLYLNGYISFEKAMELLQYDYALCTKRFYGNIIFDSVWIYDVLDPEIIIALALSDAKTRLLFINDAQIKKIRDEGNTFLKDAIKYAAAFSQGIYTFSDNLILEIEDVFGTYISRKVNVVYSKNELLELLLNN